MHAHIAIVLGRAGDDCSQVVQANCPGAASKKPVGAASVTPAPAPAKPTARALPPAKAPVPAAAAPNAEGENILYLLFKILHGSSAFSAIMVIESFQRYRGR
jgi:hypothetical protein